MSFRSSKQSPIGASFHVLWFLDKTGAKRGSELPKHDLQDWYFFLRKGQRSHSFHAMSFFLDVQRSGMGFSALKMLMVGFVGT